MNFVLVLKDTVEQVYLPHFFDIPRNIGILDYLNIQLIRTAVQKVHSELFG